MSYVTMSDLGRRHGGGGRHRHGGGGWRRPYYGGGYGGYPYYDGSLLPSPVYYVDPVGPPDHEAEAKAKAEAEAAKIKAIIAAVKSEMTKPSGMGQFDVAPVSSFYVDPMGPGARDADIDRIARDDEIVDEAIPAREALAIRRAMGLSGLGDLGDVLPSGAPGLILAAGTITAGAVIGYFAGGWILKRLAA